MAADLASEDAFLASYGMFAVPSDVLRLPGGLEFRNKHRACIRLNWGVMLALTHVLFEYYLPNKRNGATKHAVLHPLKLGFEKSEAPHVRFIYNKIL